MGEGAEGFEPTTMQNVAHLRGFVPLPHASAVTGMDAKSIRDLAVKSDAIRWAIDDRGFLTVSMADLCGLLRRGAA